MEEQSRSVRRELDHHIPWQEYVDYGIFPFMDIYAALADPTRREILARLQRRERSVNELAESLDITQPATSKHLKVLREAGFLTSRVAAQQRIYQLQPGPFRELAQWLEPYQALWNKHLGALERHLDRKKKGTKR